MVYLSNNKRKDSHGNIRNNRAGDGLHNGSQREQNQILDMEERRQNKPEIAGSMWDLPEELDMGEQSFRMAQDENTGITAIYLPKRDQWVFTRSDDERSFDMFASLSKEMDKSDNPKGELVSFLTYLQLQKENHENN